MPAITVNNIDYDKIYSSNNFGDFRFIEELEPKVTYSSTGIRRTERVAMIEFIITGTRIPVLVRDAINGSVKDPYYPNILGIACTGNTYTDKDHRALYGRWKNMIDRCYNKNNSKYKFYKDCSVCPEWLCFEVFLKDAVNLPGYEDMINNPDIAYSIDKDTLQPNTDHKIYSPSTCIWVPLSINQHQAFIDNKKYRASKYFGITVDRGRYKVMSDVRTPYGAVGTYNNEIAAVNVREFYRPTYSPNAIPNVDYPKMDLTEAIKYRRHKKHRKLMYHLIDKDK